MSNQPKFNYAAAAKAKQQQREMGQFEKQPPTQPRSTQTTQAAPQPNQPTQSQEAVDNKSSQPAPSQPKAGEFRPDISIQYLYTIHSRRRKI